MSANIAVLNRLLALYGPENKKARAQLRAIAARVLDQLWARDGAGCGIGSWGGQRPSLADYYAR